jgi:hypothetical protein
LPLCVFFGAALGNVVRGVPLDASGYFCRDGRISDLASRLGNSF